VTSADIRPLWVISAVLTVRRPLPVYPDKRTSSDRSSWSGSCQMRRRSHSIAAPDVSDELISYYRERKATSRLTTNHPPSPSCRATL